ncbi:zinc finger protein 638-like [Xiphophorus maculatus]|uniref:zinc finger protein 638-like n=1 Tax=Xiphophorus maculatus TaxID=8083 RepID=UPI000C6E821C|nr:zinc finger protein 638-like [Xiphophorus maculatus]
MFITSTLGSTDLKSLKVETLVSKTSKKMLSSSNCSSSQGPSDFDMDESGSSTMNSSHFTDETKSISDIRVDVSRKQDNNDKAGTEQSYPFPDSPENILELATKILQRFGLEKEDLESLLSYPEDQVTVTNLPAILEQICIMKKKKITDGSNFPRVTSTTGFDHFSCSEGEQIHRVDQNFGFDGVLEETSKRRSSTEVKNWDSHVQKSSSTSSSSVRTFVDHPPNNSNNLQTQPSRSLQSILSLFPLVMQETGRSSANSEGSEPKSNWSSTPEMKQIAEIKQFVSIPKDEEPGQAINDMCKNKSKANGQVIIAVETKKNQKSNQKYGKTQSYSDLNPASPPSMRPTCLPEAASTQWLLQPSGRAFLPDPTGFNGLPPQAMMEDYTAAKPRSFPHTCSLCSTVCVNFKEWIIHQNISFHIEACILFRKTYPNWDCRVPLFESFPDKDPSTSAQTFQRYDHRVGSESRSRSRSRSISSYRLENKCYRSRSSSYSPGPHFRDALMNRSKPEEWEDANTHRSLPPPSTWRDRSDSRSHRRRFSSGRSKKKKSSSDQRRKRPTRSSSKRLRSSRVEQLTKKLLRTSAVQSLMKKSQLKSVVRTLVPIILAELRKLKSSSSHSSKKKLDSNFSKVKSDLQISEPGLSRKPQDDAPKEKRMKSLDIQGTSATVVKEKKQLSVEPKVFRRRPTKPVSSTDPALHSTRNNASLPKRRMTTSRRISKAKALVSKARIILNRPFVRSLKVGTVKFEVKKQVSKRLGATKLMFTKKKVAGSDSKKPQKEFKQSLKGLEERTTEEMRQKPKIRVKHLQEDVSKEEMKENEDLMEIENLETLQTKEFEDAEALKHLEIRSADCVEVKTTTTVKLQRNLSSKPAESCASSCSVFTPGPADPPQTEQNLLKAPTPSVGSLSQSQSENQISSSRQRTEADALETGSSPDFKKRQKRKKRKTKKKGKFNNINRSKNT